MDEDDAPASMASNVFFVPAWEEEEESKTSRASSTARRPNCHVAAATAPPALGGWEVFLGEGWEEEEEEEKA